MANDITQEREKAVAAAMQIVRRIEREQGVTTSSLEAIRQEMLALAARHDLFPVNEFAPPAAGERLKRYLLQEDEGGRFAAYLLALNPGGDTKPHDHTTWAVVAGIEGQELNKIYRRTDDRSDPDHCKLEVAREFMVEPGSAIAFMPDDIHSIHIKGDGPARNLHVYGLALEKLDERRAYDAETGEVKLYNKNFMSPTSAPKS